MCSYKFKSNKIKIKIINNIKLTNTSKISGINGFITLNLPVSYIVKVFYFRVLRLDCVVAYTPKYESLHIRITMVVSLHSTYLDLVLHF